MPDNCNISFLICNFSESALVSQSAIIKLAISKLKVKMLNRYFSAQCNQVGILVSRYWMLGSRPAFLHQWASEHHPKASISLNINCTHLNKCSVKVAICNWYWWVISSLLVHSHVVLFIKKTKNCTQFAKLAKQKASAAHFFEAHSWADLSRFNPHWSSDSFHYRRREMLNWWMECLWSL